LDALTVCFIALKHKLRNNISFPEVSSPIFQESFPNTVPNSSPNLTMAGQNVGGGGGGAGGGNQIPVSVIFAKVATRYALLLLPSALHDLPENYMKSLPKFTGEGDLTAQEHINFFDQFADILGIEHEDVYSRLLVQTFEGQVRTWFRPLPAGSLRS
jgi:hypothetical protein